MDQCVEFLDKRKFRRFLSYCALFGLVKFSEVSLIDWVDVSQPGRFNLAANLFEDTILFLRTHLKIRY